MKQHDNQIHDDEIDLADLVRSLWRGKWLVVGIAMERVWGEETLGGKTRLKIDYPDQFEVGHTPFTGLL